MVTRADLLVFNEMGHFKSPLKPKKKIVSFFSIFFSLWLVFPLLLSLSFNLKPKFLHVFFVFIRKKPKNLNVLECRLALPRNHHWNNYMPSSMPPKNIPTIFFQLFSSSLFQKIKTIFTQSFSNPTNNPTQKPQKLPNP